MIDKLIELKQEQKEVEKKLIELFLSLENKNNYQHSDMFDLPDFGYERLYLNIPFDFLDSECFESSISLILLNIKKRKELREKESKLQKEKNFDDVIKNQIKRSLSGI